MKKIIYLSVILILLSSINLQAQQIPQFSQRQLDGLIFNPAIAGSTTYPEIKLHHRQQWIGFDDAPYTTMLSYHKEVAANMGLGGYLINDVTMPSTRMALNVSYAYHIPINTFFIGLGLSASVLQYSLDGSEITIENQSDPTIIEGTSDKVWCPDASFGIYIYNNRFYIGISALQLISSKVKLNLGRDTMAIIPLTQHPYFTAGYNFILSSDYDLEPSVLLSRNIGSFSSPTQIDFNLKLEYQKKFIAGLTYRHSDAAVILLGYRIKQFFLAYSCDVVTSQLRRASSTSHEILFAFHFPYSTAGKPMYNLTGTKQGQILKRFR